MTLNTRTVAVIMTIALAGAAVASGAAMASTAEDTSTSASLALTQGASSITTQPLTTEDRDGLLFMREEEKLAKDVYLALSEKWGLQIFANIASAEETHTQAVATLLSQYGITDPAVDQGRGDFIDPSLQALYDELVERGSESVTEALLVGALIEELDITDLRTRATDNQAIAQVYARLEQGSENHLRAFVRQLDKQGVSYEPTVLSQDDFDEILEATTSRSGRSNAVDNGQGNLSQGRGQGQGGGRGGGR